MPVGPTMVGPTSGLVCLNSAAGLIAKLWNCIFSPMNRTVSPWNSLIWGQISRETTSGVSDENVHCQSPNWLIVTCRLGTLPKVTDAVAGEARGAPAVEACVLKLVESVLVDEVVDEVVGVFVDDDVDVEVDVEGRVIDTVVVDVAALDDADVDVLVDAVVDVLVDVVSEHSNISRWYISWGTRLKVVSIGYRSLVVSRKSTQVVCGAEN